MNLSPDQAASRSEESFARTLFNEAEALAKAAESAAETVTIPAYERTKRGRKKLSPALPRVDVVRAAVDMRKQIEGASILTKEVLQQDCTCGRRHSPAHAYLGDAIVARILR